MKKLMHFLFSGNARPDGFLSETKRIPDRTFSKKQNTGYLNPVVIPSISLLKYGK